MNFKSYKIPSTKLMEQSQGATDTNMYESYIVLPTEFLQPKKSEVWHGVTIKFGAALKHCVK